MMETYKLEQEDMIYTVSRLNNEIKFILEDTFPTVWVEGEISNFAAPNSGHWYFSLKDASAQVRCALFRNSQKRINFTPKDGMHVLIKARATMYTNRGEYQLVAEHMEERGEGKLRRAFEELKKKLEAAGLFAAEHKKKLPPFPLTIGIVTSPTGAAIRDILTVLKRRYQCVSVVIYPAIVQGKTAAPTIVNAIETANRRNECDVLIVGRGGGSLEDLWPFNEETVAYAIYKSQIPIITGIGHEVDFTIADFVADVRAATPSAAAEISSPDCEELHEEIRRDKVRLQRLMQQKLQALTQQLKWNETHLFQQHPKRRLTERMQRVDFCELTLVQLQHRLLNQLQRNLSELNGKLLNVTPAHSIHTLQNKLDFYQHQLETLIDTDLNHQRMQLSNAAAKLDALSPLSTLKRGYAIATDTNHNVIRKASDLKTGDKLHVRLMQGSIDCQVEKIVD